MKRKLASEYDYAISIETTIVVPVLADEMALDVFEAQYDDVDTFACAIAREKLFTILVNNMVSDFEFGEAFIYGMTHADLRRAVE